MDPISPGAVQLAVTSSPSLTTPFLRRRTGFDSPETPKFEKVNYMYIKQHCFLPRF